MSDVINSDFIMDMAMTVYFEDFFVTVASLRVKTNTFVEFESLKLDIQLTSL